MSEESQEKLIFKGSSSPLMKLGTFMTGGLVTVAALVLALFVRSPWPFVLLGVAVVSLIYLAAVWTLIKVRLYEVTTERIRTSNGLMTRRTDELELYRVKDTTLIEPLFLRTFGLGHIEVATHDVSTPVLRLEAIKGAREVREELRKSIETCRDKKRVRLAELE